jgi:hypothetical protein
MRRVPSHVTEKKEQRLSLMNKWVSPLTGQLVEQEVAEAHAAELAAVVSGDKSLRLPIYEAEMVAHPQHYKGSDGTEVIDVLRAFNLDTSFELGSAVKYLLRSERKGSKIQDIKKARQMLDLWLERNDKENK